jgi:hypothetical protein
MPLFHIHSLVGTSLPSFLSGASMVYTPSFDVSSFYAWMDEYKPTWYTGSPTIHQALLAYSDERVKIIEENRLRFIRSSSAPLPPTVLIDLEKTFKAPVVESYGMTEAAYLIASNPLPPGKRKVGSVGRPVGLQLAIMDSGRLLPPGKVGEIVLQGANITRGYGVASDNENAFMDGWFRTGDQGYIDEDGYVFIIGRLKEIINRGGEKISPRQIDEVMLEHPDVREAVAFAVANDLLGEEVAAAVVLKEDSKITEYELQVYIQKKLAYFKVPKFILILDSLPKGPTGKVQRIGMAERLAVMMGDKAEERRNPDGYIKEMMARMLSDIPSYTYGGDYDEISYRSSRNRGISLILGEVTTKLPSVMSNNLNTPLMEQMSEYYSKKMNFQRAGSIIGLQTRGSRLPIYLIHSDDGTMDYSKTLVSKMDHSQPVYGFKAKGLEALDQPFEKISEMANYYLSEIKRVQKNGPYIIGGAHIGGLIAYEVAQKLTWQGETIDLLVLFGTLPSVYHNLGFMENLKLGISRIFNVKAWSKTLRHLGRDSMDIDSKMRERITNYNSVAAMRYDQKPYPGDVLLFVSEESDDSPYGREMLVAEWDKLVGGRLYSYVLSGSDERLLDEGNSSEVSRVMKKHLYGL